MMFINHKNLKKLPSSLPEKVMFFDCSLNKLSNLSGSPKEVNGDYNCSRNRLTNLIGSPPIVNGSYFCSYNNLTSLIGAPKNVFDFACSHNKLTNLIGSPSYVGNSFLCDNNHLTSLLGVPKIIKENLYIACNPNLLDVSDIWDSNSNLDIIFELNEGMAILPLIKFDLVLTNLDKNNFVLDSIQKRNQGPSKQNIIDFQYELIENGYEDNARWKPKF